MNFTFALIPRVRVNYKFSDILKSLFIKDSDINYLGLVKNLIKKYFSTDHVILTSSGRAGIYLILRSLPQKRVVIPAYTCMVVKEAAILAGKEIVYAKTSNNDFNIEELPKLDSDTILMATHQYGIPCDIEMLAEECRKSGAVLVEDCAASLGTKVNGKLVGTFGDYACFSFDSSKLINVPSKGGFIIAKSNEALAKIDMSDLLQCSLSYKLKHLMRGFVYCVVKGKYAYRIFHYITMGRKNKMHIDEKTDIDITKSEFYTHGFYEWQAYIAYSQLKELDQIISKREYIYSFYDKEINNLLIKKPPYVIGSSCIRYTIQVKNKREFYELCLRHGVDMGFSFNHISTPDIYSDEHKIANEILNIPYYYQLSDQEIKKVVEVLNNIKL